MSVHSYPEYKDSSLEWMGEIPCHWVLKPFFSIFSESKNPNAGMKSDNLLSLSYGSIVRKDIETLDGLLPASFETYQVVCPGNIVFRLTDLQNDKRSLRSAIVEENGIITSAYLAVVPRDFHPGFAHYLFRAYDLTKVFYSMGGGLRQGMKYSDMKWLPIVTPPEYEQANIAAFLDHETARIDALIAEQQRLIELLKEKRQAVISHAVTKGLDPNVPMKDSGVEWLGEVPAHWGTMALKMMVEIKDGTHGTPIYVDPSDTSFPLVTSKDFVGGDINFETSKYISETDHQEIIRRSNTQCGDVLMSMIGGNIGKAVLVKTSREFSIKNVALFKTAEDLNTAKYILYYLESGLLEVQIDLISRGGAQGFLGLGDIRNLAVPRVPDDELPEIISRLDYEVPKIDDLARAALSVVELSKERRSALISAAVTGKIDVRNWHPVEASAADEYLQAAEPPASYA